MIKKCLVCKKEFKIKPCHIKRAKFCSRKCCDIFKQGKHFSPKTEFNKKTISWNKGKKYSMKHSKQFTKGHIPWNKGKPWSKEIKVRMGINRKDIPAWNKGIKYLQITGSKNYGWKGGKIVINGYWHILDKTNPRTNSKGYIKQSKLIMEKTIGRFLKPEECVHHINGNRLDDRPENLRLFTNNSTHIKTCHHKRIKELYIQK